MFEISLLYLESIIKAVTTLQIEMEQKGEERGKEKGEQKLKEKTGTE